MSTTIRIALLLADTPNPYVLEEEGTYLDVFRAHLLDSLENVGRKDQVALDVTGFDIVGKQEFPDERNFEKGGYNAVMITGSGEFREKRRRRGRGRGRRRRREM